MAEATSKALLYADVPRRGSSSRAIRTSIYPSNGNSFVANTASPVIHIDLPGNVQNTFCDFQNSYLKFTVTNGSTGSINLEECGCLGLFQRVEILTGGQTLSYLDQYSVLAQLMMDLDTSDAFKGNVGRVLMGTGSGAVGALIGPGDSRQFSMPIILSSLFGLTKYLPLIGRDQIRIRLTMNPTAQAVIAGGNANLTYSNIEFVSYNVELGSDVMSMVSLATGNVFNMIVNDYRHTQQTLDANQTSLVHTLGFSFSSLNRILVCPRPTSSANSAAALSNANRGRRSINRFYLTIGGAKYPQREILCDDVCSEVLQELEVSNKTSGVWSHISSLNGGQGFSANNPSGADYDNCGKFAMGVDLESQRIQDNGIYSGLSTIGQTVQFNAELGAVNQAYVYDYFAEYSLMLSLDMNSTQQFVASV